MPLSWNPSHTASDVQTALTLLAPAYPDLQPSDQSTLQFRMQPDLSGPIVVRDGASTEIQYSTLTQALRALGSVMADLTPPDGRSEEHLPFSMLGIMLDCSRNAVMTPDHLKRWMRQLALLGYNMVMLYTEDTYELEGEAYFGYQRGRYTADELQDLDRYASQLGIEMIGCIQTLGHLSQIMRWSPYWEIRDTPSVLLVDNEGTYALIEKMIALYARVYQTRRIHIGMDETHDLGRGTFMDHFGYERGYDLFNRHLARVIEICKKHGLEPMIWSDMYFRMGSKTQSYYDPAITIPEEVKNAIPKETQLVYWDYYHHDQPFYEDWIQRHRDLGREPLMGSGVWTWGGKFWYGRKNTEASVWPCVKACRATGLKELFFTLWGDDGAFCEFDSALAGLAFAAEVAVSGEQDVDTDRLARRFQAICNVDYHHVLTAAEIDQHIYPSNLFWDDPIQRIYWKNESLHGADHWPKILKHYNRLLRQLKPVLDQTDPMDFAHWGTLVRYLRGVMQFNLAMDIAYPARDREALLKLRKQTARMIKMIEACNESFRRQWLKRNRPHGLATLQVRIGAQKQRWAELARQLDELLAGSVDRLPELEEKGQEPITTHARWSAVAPVGCL